MFSKDQRESSWRGQLSRPVKQTFNLKSSVQGAVPNSFLTLWAMLGVVKTSAQSQRQAYFKKQTSASRKFLADLEGAQKYQYQLPTTDRFGKKIQGKWIAIDEADPKISVSSSYAVDPSKMPVSIKRILIGLILRSSPFIQDLISREGYDLLAVFERSKEQSYSSKFTEQSAKEEKISDLFEKLLDKKFAYFSQVREVLRNFFEGLSKDQLPSILSEDDKKELNQILRDFRLPNQSNSSNTSYANQSFIETTAEFNSTPAPPPIFVDSFDKQIRDLNFYLIEQRILREMYPDKYPRTISLKGSRLYEMKLLAPKESFEADIEDTYFRNYSRDFLKQIGLMDKAPPRVCYVLKDLNLANVDLSGLQIDNFIFENCNLEGAVIPTATNLQFVGCNLNKTKWLGVQKNLTIGHNRYHLDQQIIFLRNLFSQLQQSKAFDDDFKSGVLADLNNFFIFKALDSRARSAIKTSCVDADFTECSIHGLIASNVDFRDAKFGKLKDYSHLSEELFGDYSIFFTDCENLDLSNLKEDWQEYVKLINFKELKARYEDVYGVEIVELLMNSFGDIQHISSDLYAKLSSGKKITVALSPDDYQNFYDRNVDSQMMSKVINKIAGYLRELFDQEDIEFVVANESKSSADYNIKIGARNLLSENFVGNGNMVSGYKNSQRDQTVIYFDKDKLTQKDSQLINSQYVSQAILRNAFLDVNSPNYFEDPISVGEISAFSSSSSSIDSIGISVDGKVENIIFDPFFDRFLKPADYLATRIYLEAIGRFSEKQQTKSDSLFNITSLAEVRSGMLFQKSSQALNALRISDRVVAQCQKISVHKAKDLVKHCYLFQDKSCRDNSFIGEDDQAILFELKTGEKKLILLSGGQKNITVGYPDPDPVLEAPILPAKEFDKSKLSYLAFISFLIVPVLICAVNDCLNKSQTQPEEEDGLAEARLEFIENSKEKHKIVISKQLEFEVFDGVEDYVVWDFENSSHFCVQPNQSLQSDPSRANILKINSRFKESLSIEVLDVDGSNLKSDTATFDPQEKLKLVIIEDKATKEKKYGIYRSCEKLEIIYHDPEMLGGGQYAPSFVRDLRRRFEITPTSLKKQSIAIPRRSEFEIVKEFEIVEIADDEFCPITNFENLSNFVIDCESEQTDEPNIIAISQDIFRNKNLLIKVLEVDSSYFKSDTTTFDPQRKFKLIIFEDQITKEQKFVIARGSENFQVRFCESSLSEEEDLNAHQTYFELPAGSSITAHKVTLPISKITDLEMFECTKISDPLSESTSEVYLYYSENKFEADIDLKKLNQAGIEVQKVKVANMGVDLCELNQRLGRIDLNDFVLIFESQNPKAICYGFFEKYCIHNAIDGDLIKEYKAREVERDKTQGVVMSMRPELVDGVGFSMQGQGQLGRMSNYPRSGSAVRF